MPIRNLGICSDANKAALRLVSAVAFALRYATVGLERGCHVHCSSKPAAMQDSAE